MKNKKTPGQVVVIITLFIAVMIILTIVLINIAKVSDIKTTTSQVADNGALNLGSQLGSYVKLLNDKITQRYGFLGSNCAVNWGIIVIIAGLITAILLFPLAAAGGVISALLTATGVSIVSGTVLSLMDINGTQNRAFANAVYSMTAYTGFRESVISSMLGSIQTDTATVNQTANVFQFEDRSVSPPVVYNLTDQNGRPVEGWLEIMENIRHNKPVYRYNVWYWAKRFPEVSEAGRLTPPIDNLISTINNNTRIRNWDENKWEITQLELKTRPMPAVTSQIPNWVIKDAAGASTNEIVLVGPVTLNDWAAFWPGLSDWIIALFNEGGFLVTKFKDLTYRLIETGYNITYSFLDEEAGGYNHQQIDRVNDDIRGFLTRAMELLNLPVSYRVVAINSWFSAFSNDSGTSMYTRLIEDYDWIEGWKAELQAIDSNIIIPLVPIDNGHCNTGVEDAEECPPCTCCPKECYCCGSTPCAWTGIYCACTPAIGSELCSHGDLYGYKPSPCPPQHSLPSCCSACGNDPSTDPEINKACRFQGSLNWQTQGGQTEVHQAIDILEEMQRVLLEITTAIQALKVQVDAIQANTALKEEAVYGWSDEDVRTPNQGDKIINQHVVRVKVTGYPPPGTLPTSFPYIEEESGPLPFDLTKCWYVRGAVDGWFETTVSSYAGDVPAGWWKMKTRRSVNLPEFSKDNLGAIIREIHTNINATRPVGNQETNFTDLINNFAVSSATRGHYGANKRNQIYIQRTTPGARQALP